MADDQLFRSLSGKGAIDLRCVRCGHDLRAVSIKSDCPGCKLPVERSVCLDVARDGPPRVCGRCGYSLKGLGGDRCPECGGSIAEFARREGPLWERAIEWIDAVDHSCHECGGAVEDGRCVHCRAIVSRRRKEPVQSIDHPESKRVLESFDTEPMELIKRMRTRTVVAALLVTVPVLASLVVSASYPPQMVGATNFAIEAILKVVSVLAGPLAPMHSAAFIGIGTVCLALPVAVWLLTEPVIGARTASPLLGAGSRLRRVARFSAFTWWLVPFFAFGVAVEGSSWLVWGFAISMPLALLSLAPINMHLRNLARWLVDEKADRFFNLGLWCALLAPLVPLGLLGIGGLVLLMGVAGVAASVAYYGTTIGLLILANSACWSVYHGEQRLERDARRLEKARKRFAEDIERVRNTDSTPLRKR